VTTSAMRARQVSAVLRQVRTRLHGDPVIHSRTEMGVLMVPAGKSSQAKAAEEGSSSAMGESAGQK